MVPVERIELPTFGLQNRCSTAELNRRIEVIGERRYAAGWVRLRRLEYQTCSQRARTSAPALARSNGEKAACWPPFPSLICCLTGRGASGHPRPETRCRGCRQSRCGGHSIRRRSDWWRRQPPCRPRRRRRRLRHRRASAAIVVPAVVAVLPRAIPIGLIPVDLTLIAAGIGISRSLVLAVGVWIKLRAIAGIVDDFLRHRGAGERGGEDRRGSEDSRFCHVGTPWMISGCKRARGRSFRCGLSSQFKPA